MSNHELYALSSTSSTIDNESGSPCHTVYTVPYCLPDLEAVVSQPPQYDIVRKQLTGGDSLAGKVCSQTISCAILMGTNTLPLPSKHWLTVATLRRLMVLPMIENVQHIVNPTIFPVDAPSHAVWIASCVHTRMQFIHPPISTMALLMTLAGNGYTKMMSQIKIDKSAPLYHVVGANILLRAQIGVTGSMLSDILEYYHHTCYVIVFGERMVANISPMHASS
jgi:hypothetical protein